MADQPERLAVTKRVTGDLKLGDRLRKARLGKGWTQKQAADRMGTAQAVLSRAENGRINPSWNWLRRACQVLNIQSLKIG